MDLSLHSFILVIGLVVMAFILWDGIKKVKQSRANKLRIKLDDQFDDLANDALGSEFPNGGARTLGELGDTSADNAHGDKYDELEFDDAVLSTQSANESETYVTANLLNDVEQELAEMDQDFVSEPALDADSQSELLPEPVVLEAPEEDFDFKALASKLEKADREVGEPITQADIIKVDTSKADLANTSHNSTQLKRDSAKSDSAKTTHSSMADDEKAQAALKAQKLKDELEKLQAAKKQQAAKQAYDDALKQEQQSTTANTKLASADVESKRDPLQASKAAALPQSADKPVRQTEVKPSSQSDADLKAVDQKTSVPKQVVEQNTVDKALNEKPSKPKSRESVPMLMDPVELGGAVDPNPPQQKELTLPAQPEPTAAPVALSAEQDDFEHFSALDDDGFASDVDPLHKPAKTAAKAAAEQTLAAKQYGDKAKKADAVKTEKPEKTKTSKSSFLAERLLGDRLSGEKSAEKQRAIATELDPLFDEIDTKATDAVVVGERLKDRPPAQEVLVINVLKDDGEPLQGRDLHHVFKVCDLRFGEMDIFHRFEQANAKGKIQFSVANGVEPGTFDPSTLDTASTTGISFFMSLPGPEHPMEAFDAMLEVAHVFARNFNAELHDESHSDLTPQTIEHCRHRIREFSRKQKMKATKA